MLPTFTLDSETLLRSFAVDTLPCDSHHILVACFPKSGSTWLSEVLSALPGFARINLVPVYDRREQELAFERLLVAHHLNYVAQHHCRYSLATQHCLRAFSIKPVILVRNIFDCVVSMKDHIDRGIDNPVTRIGPLAYIPRAYDGWPAEARLDFVVDMCVPWYFNFFVSWQDSDAGVWVRYEDLLADPRDGQAHRRGVRDRRQRRRDRGRARRRRAPADTAQRRRQRARQHAQSRAAAAHRDVRGLLSGAGLLDDRHRVGDRRCSRPEVRGGGAPRSVARPRAPAAQSGTVAARRRATAPNRFRPRNCSSPAPD